MSDVRPELQQIRDALDAFVDGYMATDPPQARKGKTQRMVDAVYPALARVEATLDAIAAAKREESELKWSARKGRQEAESRAIEAEEALAVRVVAAEADAVKWQEYGLRMSNDACLAEDRAVAAEAERDEARRLGEAFYADQKARAVKAERRVAELGNRLEMVRENLRHIAVSLPRAVLRQKLEDLAAIAAVSATGVPQDTASPAPAEPPPEPTEGVALTPEQILHVQRKTLSAEPPREEEA